MIMMFDKLNEILFIAVAHPDESVKDKGLAIKKAKKVFSYRPELRMPKKLLRLKNDY